MKKKLSLTALFIFFSVSNVAFAQTTFKLLVTSLVNTVFNSLISLAMVVATAAFFFGIYTYVMGAREGDSKQITKGNTFLLWGGITLFIMASIWGIIAYGQGVLGMKSIISLPRASSLNVYPPNASSVRIGSPAPEQQALQAAQAMEATKAIQSQAAREGKPMPDSVSSCTQFGFFSSLCQQAFGSKSPAPSGTSATFGTSAFNNGCDPQDPTCGPNSTSLEADTTWVPNTSPTEQDVYSDPVPNWDLDTIPTGDTWQDGNTEPAPAGEDASSMQG